MSTLVDGLTVEDFNESGWRAVIDQSERRNCNLYRGLFSQEAETAHSTGNEKLNRLFSFLSNLTSMWIDGDNPTDPLQPMWQGPTHRSPIPEDFDAALPYMAEILPTIDDPELKARVADVLWLRRRDFRAARVAVTSYLDSADLTDTEYWSESLNSVERAADIAARANQPDLKQLITARLEAALQSFTGDEKTFLPARLMNMLQTSEVESPERYATLAESFAKGSEVHADWYMAREYWLIAASWYGRYSNEEQKVASQVRAAETYVNEADARIGNEADVSHMAAAHFIEQAVHALRQIGGHKERIYELRQRLIQEQQIAVAEMRTFSVEFDATEMIAKSTEAVKGKKLYDAIFILAQNGKLPTLETLQKQADTELSGSISSFIPTTYKSTSEKTIAKSDGVSSEPDAYSESKRAQMYKISQRSHMLWVQIWIEPVREQINREHSIRIADVLALVRNNPFVSMGRELLFARGLHAGFHGDFVVATSLLIPQIENSIRYILDEQGVITSGLDDEGIQDERDLNRTLRLPEFTAALENVLSEDTVFDLRGLLIERYGSNLRNNVAHGLLEQNEFYSGACLYFWWITLRLCCIPVITGLRAQATSKVTETSSTDAVDKVQVDEETKDI